MTIPTFDQTLIDALPEGYSMRAATMDDVTAVVDLVNKHSQVLYGHPDMTEESLRHTWESPLWNLQRNSCAVVNGEGQIVGYTQTYNVRTPKVRPFVMGRVDPDYRGLGIGSAMLRWAETVLLGEVELAPPGTRVQAGIYSNLKDEQTIQLLNDMGWELTRNSLQMEIDLDHEFTPMPPEGITIRALHPGESEYEAFKVAFVSFRDHYGSIASASVEEAWKGWKYNEVDKDDYDPSIRFIALDGDQIVGVSLCLPRIDDDPLTGWLGTLGVLRKYRGRGIAKALLLHTFEAFRQRGSERLGLGVDADSLTGATRLYEGAGMFIKERHGTFTKVLRDGVDLSTQQLAE